MYRRALTDPPATDAPSSFQAWTARSAALLEEIACREREIARHQGAQLTAMATLLREAALLPAEDAIAVFGVIDTLAQAVKTALEPGDDRRIGELRADALVDLITRPNGEQRVRHDIRVIVPADTLLGLGDDLAPHPHRPGHVPRPGRRRRPLPALEPPRRIHRCEIDHTIEFPIGGNTIRVNLSALCRKHHTIKHLPGWDLIQDPDGSGTLTFLSPSGQMFRTRPPTAPGDDPDVEDLTPRRDPLPDDPPF